MYGRGYGVFDTDDDVMVKVTFGDIGYAYEIYTVYCGSYREAKSKAIDAAVNDLKLISASQYDESTFTIVFRYKDYKETDTEYEVSAYNVEDAIEAAKKEASFEFSAEIVDVDDPNFGYKDY